ncbi:Hypothetical protein BHY_1250 (plasmid) [Borrelia nietonii YOR]|uniref:BBH37-like helical domain-containing protein n=2 Tax=Borrelia TaxID=138 RepID=W5SGE0_9SPIR|nr:Hypothetical protein BHY_1250 [Borrelia nietonii YOR]AHH14387.1 Hypothetical protein BHW_0012400 [Borrelia hermsii MTW]
MESAKFLFDKAQETLKEAITERLKNILLYSFGKANDCLLVQLSRKASSSAANFLSQLEYSSAKLTKARRDKERDRKIY